jgi:hypothetical protein
MHTLIRRSPFHCDQCGTPVDRKKVRLSSDGTLCGRCLVESHIFSFQMHSVLIFGKRRPEWFEGKY